MKTLNCEVFFPNKAVFSEILPLKCSEENLTGFASFAEFLHFFSHKFSASKSTTSMSNTDLVD